MKKTIIIVLVAAVAYFVIAVVLKKMKGNKYLDYLHSLGFGVADKMTTQEQEDSYNYLYNYARRYKNNAASIVKATDPILYGRLQRIVQKYGALFNLNTDASITNIPNISTPIGAAPIVPDVKLPTAGKPNTDGNIIPPTLNFI